MLSLDKMNQNKYLDKAAKLIYIIFAFCGGVFLLMLLALNALSHDANNGGGGIGVALMAAMMLLPLAVLFMLTLFMSIKSFFASRKLHQKNSWINLIMFVLCLVIILVGVELKIHAVSRHRAKCEQTATSEEYKQSTDYSSSYCPELDKGMFAHPAH